MKDKEKAFLGNSVEVVKGGIVLHDRLVPESCNVNEELHCALRNAAKEIGLNVGQITDAEVIFFGSSLETATIYNTNANTYNADAESENFRKHLREVKISLLCEYSKEQLAEMIVELEKDKMRIDLLETVRVNECGTGASNPLCYFKDICFELFLNYHWYDKDLSGQPVDVRRAIDMVASHKYGIKELTPPSRASLMFDKLRKRLTGDQDD